MKNNFTQALKELTGFDGEPAKPLVEDAIFETVTPVQETVTIEDISISPSSDSTHITKSMVIKGNIKSKDNIIVNGEVIGDIQTTRAINATNLILGNVSAHNMLMKGARLKGDVTLEGDFVVGAGSVIVGNIKCENIDISGKIKGTCNINNSARMASNAYLVGDICADDISTEQGAKIQGTITTRTTDAAIEADFDFGGGF